MITLFLLASPTLDDFWMRVLEPLFSDPRIAIVGACIDAQKSPSLFSRLRQHLKRGRGGYVFVMFGSRPRPGFAARVAVIGTVLFAFEAARATL